MHNPFPIRDSPRASAPPRDYPKGIPPRGDPFGGIPWGVPWDNPLGTEPLCGGGALGGPLGGALAGCPGGVLVGIHVGPRTFSLTWLFHKGWGRGFAWLLSARKRQDPDQNPTAPLPDTHQNPYRSQGQGRAHQTHYQASPDRQMRPRPPAARPP